MFTLEQRVHLRTTLLADARADERIVAAAITGSAAAGEEDRWSDIDLAFAFADPADLPELLTVWTDRMYSVHGAVHHLDVPAGPWLYRVFLLADTLQVDLAFVPVVEFRALAPTFQLVFGVAADAQHPAPPSATDLAGYAWLYALHARSSLQRNRLWQAEHMIRGLRDHTLALACLRHGLPTAHGKGFDRLPTDVLFAVKGGFVQTLDPDELGRAFRATLSCLLNELRYADPVLAGHLELPLLAMADSGE